MAGWMDGFADEKARPTRAPNQLPWWSKLVTENSIHSSESLQHFINQHMPISDIKSIRFHIFIN